MFVPKLYFYYSKVRVGKDRVVVRQRRGNVSRLGEGRMKSDGLFFSRFIAVYFIIYSGHYRTNFTSEHPEESHRKVCFFSTHLPIDKPW